MGTCIVAQFQEKENRVFYALQRILLSIRGTKERKVPFFSEDKNVDNVDNFVEKYYLQPVFWGRCTGNRLKKGKGAEIGIKTKKYLC